MKVSVGLLAGGMGVRSGGGLPKAFKHLNGKPLVFHSLTAFDSMDAISTIRLTIPVDFMDIWADLKSSESFNKLRGAVLGGKERADSVLAVLRALEEDNPDFVLIHDSARPIVEKADVDALLSALDTYDGAILTANQVDTLWKVSDSNLLTGLIDRTKVVRALTPQAFHFNLIKEAYEEGAADGFWGTDDASFILRKGGKVKSVKTVSASPKVTYPEDFKLVETLMRESG